MKNPLKILSVLCLSSFSMLSAGGDHIISITALQIEEFTNLDARAYIQAKDFENKNWESISGCTQNSYVTFDPATTAGKIMYSTALAAYMSGKKVKIRLKDKSCLGNFDKTSMIRIL